MGEEDEDEYEDLNEQFISRPPFKSRMSEI